MLESRYLMRQLVKEPKTDGFHRLFTDLWVAIADFSLKPRSTMTLLGVRRSFCRVLVLKTSKFSSVFTTNWRKTSQLRWLRRLRIKVPLIWKLSNGNLFRWRKGGWDRFPQYPRELFRSKTLDGFTDLFIVVLPAEHHLEFKCPWFVGRVTNEDTLQATAPLTLRDALKRLLEITRTSRLKKKR